MINRIGYNGITVSKEVVNALMGYAGFLKHIKSEYGHATLELLEALKTFESTNVPGMQVFDDRIGHMERAMKTIVEVMLDELIEYSVDEARHIERFI